MADRTPVPELFSVLRYNWSSKHRLYESFLLDEIRVNHRSLLNDLNLLLLLFNNILSFDIRSAFSLRDHIELFVFLCRYGGRLSDHFVARTDTVLLNEERRVVAGLQGV